MATYRTPPVTAHQTNEPIRQLVSAISLDLSYLDILGFRASNQPINLSDLILFAHLGLDQGSALRSITMDFSASACSRFCGMVAALVSASPI